MNLEQTFEQRIYNTSRTWKNHPCGSGSTPENTADIKQALPPALKRLNIHTLLDAPCGDHSWISEVKWQHPVNYIGADIVSRLIEDNRARYPGVDFRVLDIISDPLPDADMILVRDCLIHLSNGDVIKFLHNFLQSNIQCMAVTNYNSAKNTDIALGQYRPTNLCGKPFNLGEPIETWPDGVDINAGARHIAVWHRSQVELALESV